MKNIKLNAATVFIILSSTNLIAQDSKPPQELIGSPIDLQMTYADIVQLEREASVQVVSLDKQFRLMEQPTLDQQRILLEAERELFTTELPINEKLRALYASATEGENEHESNPLLVRTSLLHWTILLRRISMRSFHTQVGGLEDDPDCRGDIIGDQLLLRYFDTLFEEHDGTRREVEAVRALADLARQSACIGAQQSAKLASDLYWSFVELRGFLRLNGLEHLVPYVVQAAAAPLLLFYDVEKYRGPQSPLARWFSENYDWLVAGAETKRNPTYWHGLWLYDRRSGHLLGYRPIAEPVDENDVHLASFFASITSRENLGEYGCSFAEMIERGLSPQGYLCVGSICGEAKKSSEASAQLSSTGLSKEAVLSTLYPQPAGGHGSGSGTGGGPCGNGVSGFGRNRNSDVIRCLTQQIMRPGDKVMRCVAEAIGLCANPVDKATKELQQALFAGVRVGDRCQISQGKDDPNKELYEFLDKLEREGVEKFLDRKRLERLELLLKEYNEAIVKSDEARGRALEALKELEEAEKKNASKEEIEKLRKEMSDAIDKLNKAEKEEKNKLEKLKEASGRDSEKKELVRCPPDTPECGNNNCTAMSEAMRRTMRCFEQAVLEEELEMLGRQPGFSDPSPLDDNGQAPEWFKCFDSFESFSLELQKQCWAYDCGPGTMTVFSEGKCGCGSGLEGGEAGPRLTGMCHAWDCPEGTPRVQDGKCTCGGGLGVGTGGPIPKGPFITSSPRFFSEVRLLDMPPRGGGVPPFDSLRGGPPFP